LLQVFLENITFLIKIITFKNIASIYFKFLKNNHKTAINEMLLRIASEIIDFFEGEKLSFKKRKLFCN
jgi:hypothetical protein